MNSTTEDTSHIALKSLIAALSYSLAVTLPANAQVSWLILREKRLAPDVLYFNLSLVEILFSVSTVWGFVGYSYTRPHLLEAFAFFRGLFYTGRPLFQVLICLECYMGVNHPVLFLRLKPLRYRLTCCAACWLLVAFSCIYSRCTYAELPHLFTVFTQNLLFYFLVLFCLVSVLRTLKRPGPGGNKVQKKSNRTKTRAIKILSVTMVSMTVNFLLCIGPIPLQLCLDPAEFLVVLTICAFLSLVTGSMQPLIYLQRAEKILCLQIH